MAIKKIYTHLIFYHQVGCPQFLNLAMKENHLTQKTL